MLRGKFKIKIFEKKSNWTFLYLLQSFFRVNLNVVEIINKALAKNNNNNKANSSFIR